MGWPCAVCTYLNSNDVSVRCEICETPKGAVSPDVQVITTQQINKNNNNSNNTRKIIKASVQATLFGGVVVTKAATTTNPTKKNKGKVAEVVVVDDVVHPQVIIVQNHKNHLEKNIETQQQQQTNRGTSYDSVGVGENQDNKLLFVGTQKAIVSSSTTSGGYTYDGCVFDNNPHPTLSDLKVRAKHIMKTIFKIEKLRYLQPLAVTCALKRQNQIIVMATGGGKVRTDFFLFVP